MKKFLSCVLALALVFSLMSMTVFAGEDHPTDPSQVAGKQYNVVGNQGDTTDTSISYQDGKTEDQFGDTTVGANVGVTFEKTTTTTDPDNPNQTVTNTVNVLEHRYAIDILYTELIFDLTDLNSQSTSTGEGDTTTTTTTYKFVWDVTQHTYVMVEYDPDNGTLGEVVESNDPALTDSEITIAKAFQIINHSDLGIKYDATIAPNNTYASVLNLGINDAGTTTITDVTVGACQATENGTDANTGATLWKPAEPVEGIAHTIYATPDSDWATTIGVLVNNNQTTSNVTVGSITITVKK